MQYIILSVFLLIIVNLVVRLRKKDNQLREVQAQIEQVQAQSEQAIRMSEEVKLIRDEIWDYANTIHLYAALSEEESRSSSLNKKQSEIIRLSEIILHQIQK